MSGESFYHIGFGQSDLGSTPPTMTFFEFKMQNSKFKLLNNVRVAHTTETQRTRRNKGLKEFLRKSCMGLRLRLCVE